MPYEELKRTTIGRGNPSVLAKFSIKPSGPGILRITVNGMNFLAKNNVNFQPDDTIRVFFDHASGNIAIRRDSMGPFSFAVDNKTCLRLSFRDLTDRIKESTTYTIELPSEFDLVFVPLKNANSVASKSNAKQVKSPDNRIVRGQSTDEGIAARL